jgi:F420-non-reducing hydrogenase iron-sulfur subunit
VQYLKRLLDEIGLGGERLEMATLSSAEGARFAQIATDMTERIRQLGPSPLRQALARDEHPNT